MKGITADTVTGSMENSTGLISLRGEANRILIVMSLGLLTAILLQCPALDLS